jgi:hypothetical protein
MAMERASIAALLAISALVALGACSQLATETAPDCMAGGCSSHGRCSLLVTPAARL